LGYGVLCFTGAAISWAAGYWLGEWAVTYRLAGWGTVLTVVGVVLVGFGLKALWKAYVIKKEAARGSNEA
jgi:hypothetical protein